MLQVHDKTAFHEDGTPRRKYEPESGTSARTPLKIVIGIAIAGAIGYAKNLMATTTRHEQQSPAADDFVAKDNPSTDADFAEVSEYAQSTDDQAAPTALGPRSSSQTMGRQANVVDISAEREKRLEKSAFDIATFANPTAQVSFQFGNPIHLDDAGTDSSGGGSSAVSLNGTSPDRMARDPEKVAEDENRRPYSAGSISLGTFLMNGAIFLSIRDLLTHVIDPDGDHLTLTGLQSSSGQLVDLSGGRWFFLNDYDVARQVTFTFRVNDGHHETEHTAALDFETWSIEKRVLDGFEAAGAVGPDLLNGEGSQTPVTVNARDGDDVTIGSDGNDRLVGGEGADVLLGGDGDDVLLGGNGDDTLYGGAGDDWLFGEAGDDVLSGDSGDDRLDGQAGNDTLIGGAGNDVIAGGQGEDAVDGGEGDDTYVAAVSDGDDVVDGGEGRDTYDASRVAGNIVVNVAAGTVTGSVGEDVVSGIETFVTGSGDDTIAGSAADETFVTGAGDDTYVAAVSDGDDVVDGGEGHDTFVMEGATAPVVCDLNAGTVYDGTSIDLVTNFEEFHGGNGNDTFIADNRATSYAGGAGSDEFIFLSTSGAGNGRDARDIILDFEVGDRIDLNKLFDEFRDTELYDLVGDRKFRLIGMDDVFSTPGQLRFAYEGFDDDPRRCFLLEGNIDGNSNTDFQIEFAGDSDMAARALMSLYSDNQS